MSQPGYDKKKVRRAMLIAPCVALLGILPFITQLNLTIVQLLLLLLVALVVSYLLGLLLGAPGYLLLKRLGLVQTKYLMAYAVLVVIAAPIVLDDIYAMLTFGPPTLLAAGAFCYLRGPEAKASPPGQ